MTSMAGIVNMFSNIVIVMLFSYSNLPFKNVFIIHHSSLVLEDQQKGHLTEPMAAFDNIDYCLSCMCED